MLEALGALLEALEELLLISPLSAAVSITRSSTVLGTLRMLESVAEIRLIMLRCWSVVMRRLAGWRRLVENLEFC